MLVPNNLHTKNCLIFAHRGMHDAAMENTQPAFDKAFEYAIDGIETDVQLTQDEITVLWHDRFLDKLGLTGKRIDDFSYTQLKSLSAKKLDNTSIMTLQEFLDAYRRRCRLLIEIKNRAWESVTRHEIKIQQTLSRIGDSQKKHIIVSSFNLNSLIYAHHCQPDFPLICNFEPTQSITDVQQVLTTHSFLYGLCLPIETLDQTMVNCLRHHENCIAVYTCNSDEEINKALKLGVDILISDYPHKALKIRAQ